MGLVDNTPTGRLILQIMLSFAEFEREMIKERTAAGKAIARQKPGYNEGRPKQITPEIIKQIKKGVSWKELGISRTTWYRYNKNNVYPLFLYFCFMYGKTARMLSRTVSSDL